MITEEQCTEMVRYWWAKAQESLSFFGSPGKGEKKMVKDGRICATKRLNVTGQHQVDIGDGRLMS